MPLLSRPAGNSAQPGSKKFALTGESGESKGMSALGEGPWTAKLNTACRFASMDGVWPPVHIWLLSGSRVERGDG